MPTKTKTLFVLDKNLFFLKPYSIYSKTFPLAKKVYVWFIALNLCRVATALNDVDNIGQNGWVQSSTCARDDGRSLVADDDKLKGGGTPLLMCVASAIGKPAFQEMKMRTAASR